MNKKSYIPLALIPILIASCQGASSQQLSISFADANYVTDLESNATTDVRSLDGIGNNIVHPEWGSVGQPFIRHVPAQYADGISSPAGADRPSPRVISNTFSESPEDGILNDRDFSAFVYAWG